MLNNKIKIIVYSKYNNINNQIKKWFNNKFVIKIKNKII